MMGLFITESDWLVTMFPFCFDFFPTGGCKPIEFVQRVPAGWQLYVCLLFLLLFFAFVCAFVCLLLLLVCACSQLVDASRQSLYKGCQQVGSCMFVCYFCCCFLHLFVLLFVCCFCLFVLVPNWWMQADRVCKKGASRVPAAGNIFNIDGDWESCFDQLPPLPSLFINSKTVGYTCPPSVKAWNLWSEYDLVRQMTLILHICHFFYTTTI